jgi:chemotaxis protein CheZ
MRSYEEIMEEAVSSVASQVADSVKGAVMTAVEKTLSETMRKALAENEFYRHLNTEMRSGLQTMYKEISEVSGGGREEAAHADKTGRLFSEASRQLEEVMATTLNATDSIMSAVEQLLDRQSAVADLLAAARDSAPGDVVEELAAHNAATEETLTTIMTTLSFQDLTGQRVKKVVKVLGDIQQSIFELYVSGGLMLKSREEAPDKELRVLAEESRKKLEEIKEIKGSELKGPTLDVSQSDVDSLLADLGL